MAKKIYNVYDEKGGCVQVRAENKKDAINKYWEGLESIFSHIEKSCSCFDTPKPFPREKYIQPIKVERIV